MEESSPHNSFGSQTFREPEAPVPNAPGTTDTDLALKALEGRPEFSVRMQVYVAISLSFVLLSSVSSALLISTYMIDQKIRFLEISNRYLFEIQQARRFEKNYLLYGANLNDALENLSTAQAILEENSAGVAELMGEEPLGLVLSHLARYRNLLEKLETIDRNPAASDYPIKREEAESEVRRHGHETVSFAQELMWKEKAALDKIIVLSRRVHIFSYLFLFVFFAFNSYFLGRRMLRPLRRFVSYAERIAAGDYSPIMPVRRYRDEFSNLAAAVNEMIKEIEAKQDQLIQSHKVTAIGLLTSGVAHELNNPINNINITAEYILENFEELADEDKRTLLRDIMQQGERASSTVGELLHFTRAKADAFEELDITMVVDDTLNLLNNQLRIRQISLDKQFPEDVPLVRGNRNNLQQVFLNLFLNAIQAMPEGGTLRTVVSDTHVGLLQIDVIDNGPGIEPEHLQRIFDPFFTTKEVGEGTGLGLAVCFGIVNKHGGNINVSSELGVGSTFSVFLPSLARQSTAAPEASA